MEVVDVHRLLPFCPDSSSSFMLTKVTPSARVQAADIDMTCLGHMDFNLHGIPSSPRILGMGQNIYFHISLGMNLSWRPIDKSQSFFPIRQGVPCVLTQSHIFFSDLDGRLLERGFHSLSLAPKWRVPRTGGCWITPRSRSVQRCGPARGALHFSRASGSGTTFWAHGHAMQDMCWIIITHVDYRFTGIRSEAWLNCKVAIGGIQYSLDKKDIPCSTFWDTPLSRPG